MSAGLVSGVAALLVAQGLSAEEVRQVLVTTTRDPATTRASAPGWWTPTPPSPPLWRCTRHAPWTMATTPHGSSAPWLAPLAVVAAAIVAPAALLGLVRHRARAT